MYSYLVTGPTASDSPGLSLHTGVTTTCEVTAHPHPVTPPLFEHRIYRDKLETLLSFLLSLATTRPVLHVVILRSRESEQTKTSNNQKTTKRHIFMFSDWKTRQSWKIINNKFLACFRVDNAKLKTDQNMGLVVQIAVVLA